MQGKAVLERVELNVANDPKSSLSTSVQSSGNQDPSDKLRGMCVLERTHVALKLSYGISAGYSDL